MIISDGGGVSGVSGVSVGRGVAGRVVGGGRGVGGVSEGRCGDRWGGVGGGQDGLRLRVGRGNGSGRRQDGE